MGRKYGFFDACDYTPSRVRPGHRFEIVRCWMAHHQGMSLVAAATFFATPACNADSIMSLWWPPPRDCCRKSSEESPMWATIRWMPSLRSCHTRSHRRLRRRTDWFSAEILHSSAIHKKRKNARRGAAGARLWGGEVTRSAIVHAFRKLAVAGGHTRFYLRAADLRSASPERIDRSGRAGLQSCVSALLGTHVRLGARAILSLRDSYRHDLRTVKQATGFGYMRFHAIFDDEVGVYDEVADGKPVYNFSYVDQIYDGLLQNGVRPFVELSFMPGKLAAQQIVHSFWYRPIVSPPKDWRNGKTSSAISRSTW